MTQWTTADIPPQAGRTAIVTGTGGLGFETALALAGAGGDVILAGRSAVKGAEAVAAIAAATPGAAIRFEMLDLASLASVKDFAARLIGQDRPIDILVNNAGVMAPPVRRTTADGFELQFGTNYLGHYALTALLLPLLRRGSRPRVISVSSIAHRRATMNFEDLNYASGYRGWLSYGQSKLAMLIFALELQRRSDAGGWGLTSIAAHPGFSRTALIANGPGADSAMAWLSKPFMPFISQSAAAGAWPQIYAATAPDAKPGGYYGPDGFRELKGGVAPAEIRPQALAAGVGGRLWDASAKLTGIAFPALDPAAAAA
jgi:NAD(P)-dependent dehydrogenase (short-subunit alcohol dehydrogenase family)